MKAVVSENGQVMIPKALRDRLGLYAGTELDFAERAGTLVARKRGQDRFAGLYGILPSGNPDAIVRRARGPAWNRRQDPETLVADTQCCAAGDC